jgi:hypothetical protein
MRNKIMNNYKLSSNKNKLLGQGFMIRYLYVLGFYEDTDVTSAVTFEVKHNTINMRHNYFRNMILQQSFSETSIDAGIPNCSREKLMQII